MSLSVPLAFERQKPNNENVLNDHLNALFVAEKTDYEREFPVLKFAFARTIPDHSFPEYDLLLEAKLMKKNSSKADFTNQIAADIIKYNNSRKLFFIYDPERRITNDEEFKNDFENNRGCYVHIVR